MANATFRSATQDKDTSGAAATINATVPTGHVQDDGDVIAYVSWVSTPGGAPTHSTPAGYTLAGSASGTDAGGSNDVRMSVFYRIAPASPAAVTLTSNKNSAHRFIRAAIQNVNTSTLIDVFGTIDAVPSAGTSFAASSVTTTEANVLLLFFAGAIHNVNFTAPAGMTEEQDVYAGGMELADLLQAAAGASGSKTATADGTSDGYAVLLGIKSQAAVVVGVPLLPNSRLITRDPLNTLSRM